MKQRDKGGTRYQKEKALLAKQTIEFVPKILKSVLNSQALGIRNSQIAK